MRQSSPAYAPAMLPKQDGRTRGARMVRDLRRDLITQLGGNPSPSQSVIIDRAANLSMRLARMDAVGEAGAEYRAATETLLRLLASIGLASGAGAQPLQRRHP